MKYSSDYISVGYMLMHAVDRPTYVDARYVPDVVLTASNMLANVCPDLADHDLRHRELRIYEYYDSFGLPMEVIEDASQWIDQLVESLEFGWPHLWSSTALAREFVRRYCKRPRCEDIFLVGIGLPLSDIEEVVSASKQMYRQKAPGIHVMARRHLAMERGGKVMGVDVAGYEFGHLDSWLTSHMVEKVVRDLGMPLNEYGLFETLHHARSCSEYLSMPSSGAEPIMWNPWLVVKYELL